MIYIDTKTVSYNELRNLIASEAFMFDNKFDSDVNLSKLIQPMFTKIMCRDTLRINAYKDNIGKVHMINGQNEFTSIAELIKGNIYITDFPETFKQFNDVPFSEWHSYNKKQIEVTPVFELHMLECANEDEKQFYLNMIKNS